MAILINQHCQHKTSLPPHTKVKRQLATKREKIAIIEEKIQQENSDRCGRKIQQLGFKIIFKKNEYSNQKQT